MPLNISFGNYNVINRPDICVTIINRENLKKSQKFKKMNFGFAVNRIIDFFFFAKRLTRKPIEISQV